MAVTPEQIKAAEAQIVEQSRKIDFFLTESVSVLKVGGIFVHKEDNGNR